MFIVQASTTHALSVIVVTFVVTVVALSAFDPLLASIGLVWATPVKDIAPATISPVPETETIMSFAPVAGTALYHNSFL